MKTFLFASIIHQIVCERQLQCSYQTGNKWDYWPSFEECYLTNVDLTREYKSEILSFSGSISEKSKITGVTFYSFNNPIEFIPNEVAKQFLNLNTFVIWDSNLPVITNDLFSKDLKNIQFLNFYDSKVELIESEAFSELINLKYIYLRNNPLKALKFRIFKMNLKLEIVRLPSNQISMMNPFLFEDLTNLKFVMFEDNECVSKSFGCESCSVSQSKFKSDLITCFSNCKSAPECSKYSLVEEISENMDRLKTEITSNTDLIEKKFIDLNSICENIKAQNMFYQAQNKSSKNIEVCSSNKINLEENFGTQNSMIKNVTETLETKIDLALEIMKNFNEKTVVEIDKKVEESNSKTRQYLEESSQATVRSLKEIVLNTTDSKLSQHLQKTEEKVDKAIELVNAKLSKAEMALELEKANHVIDRKTMQEEIRDLKEKLAIQSQDMKAMKEELVDFVKKQLLEFEEKLRVEAMP